VQLGEENIVKALWGALVVMVGVLWKVVKGEHVEIKQRLDYLETTKVSRDDLDSLKTLVINSMDAAERRGADLRQTVETTRQEARESASRIHEKVEAALTHLDRKIENQAQNVLDIARNRNERN
jgi:gas vesicle protein